MDFILPGSKNIWVLIWCYSGPLDKAEGEGRVKPTFRDNDKRLVEVKGRYDPTNLFRVNQNIKLKAIHISLNFLFSLRFRNNKKRGLTIVSKPLDPMRYFIL